MLRIGILNPALLGLLARILHTNTLVIVDRGFPFWLQLEIVDLSLVDGIPTVAQVLDALRQNLVIGRAWAAEGFKQRGPHAIGLIRTGDTIPYANLIIESV